MSDDPAVCYAVLLRRALRSPRHVSLDWGRTSSGTSWGAGLYVRSAGAYTRARGAGSLVSRCLRGEGACTGSCGPLRSSEPNGCGGWD
jgi:hypothetical protein